MNPLITCRLTGRTGPAVRCHIIPESFYPFDKVSRKPPACGLPITEPELCRDGEYVYCRFHLRYIVACIFLHKRGKAPDFGKLELAPGQPLSFINLGDFFATTRGKRLVEALRQRISPGKEDGRQADTGASPERERCRGTNPEQLPVALKRGLTMQLRFLNRRVSWFPCMGMKCTGRAPKTGYGSFPSATS